MSDNLKPEEDLIRQLALIAYRRGWNDFIAGDDVRSVDCQSEDQIMAQILNEFFESLENEES